MDAARRAEIRARADAATPEPWESYQFDESQGPVIGPRYDGNKQELVATVSIGSHRPHGQANWAFIEHARTDVTDLLDALDALDAETARADRAEAQVAALEAENARLRDAVKGSWRFWAQTVIDAPTLLDRGYTVLRVRTDQFKAFDDIFRASAALAAPDPEPA